MNMRFASVVAGLVILLGSASFSRADNFKLDPAHTQVIFRVEHFGVSKIFGRFNSVTGTFVTDDDPAKMSFEATVTTDSVDTGSAARDKHLKTPDFFNANQFPEITFKSTSIKKNGDAFEVTGDLTLHGVTKSITTTLTKIGQVSTPQGERAGFDGQFNIKRSDFGMTKMVGPVGDDVSLMLNLEGIKQ